MKSMNEFNCLICSNKKLTTLVGTPQVKPIYISASKTHHPDDWHKVENTPQIMKLN